jgi:hypothetical protein
MNRQGKQLTSNFPTLIRKETNQTLIGIHGRERLLVIFFNPDCDHCRAVLRRIFLNTSRRLNILSLTTEVNVTLAIYAEGDKTIGLYASGYKILEWIFFHALIYK